jgi:hypothetical protein
LTGITTGIFNIEMIRPATKIMTNKKIPSQRINAAGLFEKVLSTAL